MNVPSHLNFSSFVFGMLVADLSDVEKISYGVPTQHDSLKLDRLKLDGGRNVTARKDEAEEKVMNRDCTCNKELFEEEFTEEQWSQVDRIIEKYRYKPGALIPVLEEVQGITGYLPEPIQRRVASGLSLPLSQVYGVVTFYSFFTMTPRGKHQVRVCLGTACHVRGSKRVLEEMESKLGIERGECTDDREFSLDIVRCVGACGLAPVMVVDEDTHKQVKVVKLDQIMGRYRNGSKSPEE